MLKYKKALGLLLALLMTAALFAGCGAPGNVTVGGEGGHILKVGWCTEPDTLNPITSYSTESLQLTSLIYETLLGYDAKMNTTYQLAESYEYSNDNKTVTYHLVHDAKWHDGEPFTSADVVDTYMRIKVDKLSEAVQFAEHLESVTAPDEYTVVMEFSEPQAFNMAFVVPILPKHIWGEMSAEEIEAFPNNEPIGTGPYKFVEWKQGTVASVARNEDYHGTQPGPDGVTWVLYGNEEVATQALKAGEVDVLTEVSATLFDSLKDAENIVAVNLPSYSFHYVGINCYQDPVSQGNKLLLDKTVRQALAHCMNKAQMVEICLSGYGQVGTSILPSAFDEWKHQFTDEELIGYDIEKANSMLEAAGYVDSDGDGIREKNGEKLDFRIFTVETTASDVRAAQLLRDSAELAGIKLTLTTMDENTMGGVVYDTESADFDLFVWAWDSDYPDPGYLLGMPLTEQIGNNNEVYYSNPTYDQLYSKQSTQVDAAERKATINEMEKMLYDDCAANILWYQDKLQAYRTDRFTGWQECDGGIIYCPTYVNYKEIQPVE